MDVRRMEYLVTASEMKECDRNTIEGFGVPSLVLMERAALACAGEILGAFSEERKTAEMDSLWEDF